MNYTITQMLHGLQLLSFLSSKKYRIKSINIVYLEDADADTWEPLQERQNAWNDVRIILRDDGTVLLSCWATTEPGTYYTENPLNPGGAFRIAFGQHLDAWTFGMHHRQSALIQCGTISGHRDFNTDYLRTGDKVVTGDGFGINQHTTADDIGASPPRVDKWSAGCLVGRNSSTHYNKFIPYLRSSGLSKFDTTVVSGDDFSNFTLKHST
jgi:hypothetical protein